MNVNVFVLNAMDFPVRHHENKFDLFLHVICSHYCIYLCLKQGFLESVCSHSFSLLTFIFVHVFVCCKYETLIDFCYSVNIFSDFPVKI